ncbi:methyl-accepting chemotaxis protein [Domibacillus robiginosus]|uniref:methyl-accepting chemotaxis protein n=1 Tax=Domibacillus robiginosus TaxID=1071054 RepID=UPI00067AD414|nr:methyl-accepting chemotaxis protein [Domibacillus robiginosus]
MKRKKTGSLKQTVIVLVTVLLIGLFLMIGSFMYMNTKKAIDQTVRETSILHAERIADSIEPEQYAGFLTNPKKDETYEKLRIQLNDYREKVGAMYVYTLQADGESLGIMVDGMAKAEDAVAIGEPTTATTFEDVAPVFKGETAATEIVSDPDYGDYMSAFAPIKNLDGQVIGVLGVDMEASLVQSIVKNVLQESLPLLVAGLLGTLALLLGILFWFLTKRLNPLTKLNAAAALVSKGHIGEAKREMDASGITSNDEIGLLGRSIQTMIDTLESMLKDIQLHSTDVKEHSEALQDMSHHMKESSGQIAVTMEEMATATEQQARAATGISEEMNRFSSLISETVKQGDAISGSSNEMMQRTKEGEAMMAEAISQMDETRAMVHQSVRKVTELEEKTNEVHALVSFISGVADQTNLLALNAAIEAARAGEAGRGFAVVAEEVRKLSDQVSTSVQGIQRIVQSVNETTNEMAAFLEKSLQQVEASKTGLDQTGAAFGSMAGEIQSMDQSIKQMQSRLQEVLNRQSQMTSSLSEVAAISEQSAAGIEEVTASAEQMNGLAHTTQDQVNKLQMMSGELNELNQKFTL